jgi:hypothetical protein
MQKIINQATAYLKTTGTYGKSRLRRFLDGCPGFFAFLGFEATRAFQTHNAWFLFLFCFFVIFSEFRQWRSELKFLGLLGLIGLIATPLGIIGIIKV